MKFHRFKIAKLIRDKLPSIGASLGFRHQIQRLQGQDHIDHLKLKLLEEAVEVQEATSKSDLAEEMADVFEVLHALAKANKISLEEIEQKRREKADLRGGFDNVRHLFIFNRSHRRYLGKRRIRTAHTTYT
jgi:predicted house-cleaning noncanonical NTP pyrophosphatase (MazG superfamily)